MTDIQDVLSLSEDASVDERTRKLLISLRQAKLFEVDAIEEFLGMERTAKLREKRNERRHGEFRGPASGYRKAS